MKKVGIFIFLLFLFSACGTPVVTEPVIQAQRTQTSRPLVTLTPLLRPTSTLDKYNQEAKDQYGGFRFCQVWPESVWFGSTIKVSVFGMPPNDKVSIYVFPHQESTNTFMTDGNGYVNADIMIPMNADLEMNMVVVEGTGASATCSVWVWSEEYLPTYYAGLTKTVTPTLSLGQISITATQQLLHNKLDKYCRDNQARGFRFSPDGQWVVVFCSSDTIEVVRVDETKKWEVSADALINPYTEYFIGLNHWSNDGVYAYVSSDPHTDGYWEPFHQGIVLYRLNLETGQINEVLPLGKSDWIFYSFSFSPDDKILAYIVTDQSPVILNLRDIQSGDEQSFELDPKYNTGGGFVWSPDSQKLVFSITQFNTSTYEYIATSIILWDKDELKLTELIKDHQSRMRVIEWVDQTKIIVKAEILEKAQIKTQNYELDLTDNELTELNP
ncbi:MAG TPA: hypothetical protein VF918_18270 [Anaerolineales bacterium]